MSSGIFKLVSENLTDVGRQGGSSFVNFTEYFYKVADAISFAQKDYGKPIAWQSKHTQYDIFSEKLTSGDLSYVMYNIDEIEIK